MQYYRGRNVRLIDSDQKQYIGKIMSENTITRDEFKKLCIDDFLKSIQKGSVERAKKYLDEESDEVDEYVDGGFYDVQEVIEGRDNLEQYGMTFGDFCKACASAVGWNMMMSC